MCGSGAYEPYFFIGNFMQFADVVKKCAARYNGPSRRASREMTYELVVRFSFYNVFFFFFF